MWTLGEQRYVYASVVSTSGDITIASATYSIFDTADETVVTSGIATISGQTISFLWLPGEAGNYLAQFAYIVDDETFKSSQVIEVRETM